MSSKTQKAPAPVTPVPDIPGPIPADSGPTRPIHGPREPVRECIGALGMALLVFSPAVAFPFGRDQATFAWVGRIIVSGGMPYRDAWEVKPPGIYLLYALFAWFCPDSASLMVAVRVADVCLVALISVLLVAAARRMGEAASGPPSALLFSALYLQGSYWSLAQAESFALPLLLGITLLALLREPGPRALAGIGLLCGAVALLKFPLVLPAAPWVLHALRLRTPGTGPRVAALAAGAALLPAGAVTWLAVQGALEPYLAIQRDFVLPYSRLIPARSAGILADALTHTAAWGARVWLPLLLAVMAAGRRRSRECAGVPARRLLTVSFLLAVVVVWVQGKYFGYHWQPALPFLALLAAPALTAAARMTNPGPHTPHPAPQTPPPNFPRAGLALTNLASRFSHLATRAARVSMTRHQLPALRLLTLLWVVLASGSHYRDALLLAAGRMTRTEWLTRFGPPGGGDYSFVADLEAARRIRMATTPGDAVLVWGFEPALYLFSERDPPTRFFFNVGVAAPFAPYAWKQEFLADLRRRPPALVVVVRNDAIPWASGRQEDSAGQLQQWKELRDWLATRYRPAGQFEDFAFYEPRSRRR